MFAGQIKSGLDEACRLSCKITLCSVKHNVYCGCRLILQRRCSPARLGELLHSLEAETMRAAA